MDCYFDPTTITLTHFFYSMSNCLKQLQIRKGQVSYHIHYQQLLSFMLKHRMQGLQQFSSRFRAYESANEGNANQSIRKTGRFVLGTENHNFWLMVELSAEVPLLSGASKDFGGHGNVQKRREEVVGTKRKRYTEAFKAKVTIEAVRGGYQKFCV